MLSAECTPSCSSVPAAHASEATPPESAAAPATAAALLSFASSTAAALPSANSIYPLVHSRGEDCNSTAVTELSAQLIRAHALAARLPPTPLRSSFFPDCDSQDDDVYEIEAGAAHMLQDCVMQNRTDARWIAAQANLERSLAELRNKIARLEQRRAMLANALIADLLAWNAQFAETSTQPSLTPVAESEAATTEAAPSPKCALCLQQISSEPVAHDLAKADDDSKDAEDEDVDPAERLCLVCSDLKLKVCEQWVEDCSCTESDEEEAADDGDATELKQEEEHREEEAPPLMEPTADQSTYACWRCSRQPFQLSSADFTSRLLLDRTFTASRAGKLLEEPKLRRGRWYEKHKEAKKATNAPPIPSRDASAATSSAPK